MKRSLVLYLIFTTLLGCGPDSGKSKEGVETDLKNYEAELLAADKTLTIVDFKDLDRHYLSLRNDTTYVVNFWATWCKPCVKELPYFEQIGENYKDKQLKVILVSLDFPEHIESKVLPFIAKEKISSKVVLLDDADANTWIPKVDPEWQGSIPATLIFNREKQKFFEKQLTLEDLQNTIGSFL